MVVREDSGYDGGVRGLFSSASTSIGNPAPGRSTKHTYGAGAIRVAHLSSNCFYPPASQGSLASITYSYDAKLDVGSNQVAYRLILLQNNTYYIGPLDTVALDTWTSFGATLTAVDFKAVKGEGPERPDFSCTGPIIQFGYETSNSATANATVTTVSHMDNWSASWKQDKPCEGPLPAMPRREYRDGRERGRLLLRKRQRWSHHVGNGRGVLHESMPAGYGRDNGQRCVLLLREGRPRPEQVLL